MAAAVGSVSSGKCPRRVESLRLTKLSVNPSRAAAVRAASITSATTASTLAGPRLRELVSTYTAGVVVEADHADAGGPDRAGDLLRPDVRGGQHRAVDLVQRRHGAPRLARAVITEGGVRAKIDACR